MGVQMSEGVPTQSGYARSTGTVHALNLMVDFPDAHGEGTALDRLGEFFPQTRDWFRTASYGKLDYRPEAPIRHWLRMPKTFAAYGIERGAPFDPGYRDLIDDIVAKADPDVDFRDYDLINILVTPNSKPLGPGHGAVRDVRSTTTTRRSPTASRSPTRRSSTAARTTARARTPRPDTAYSPTRTATRSACPTSTPRTAAAPSGTGTS